MNDISANDNRGIQHFELGPKLTATLLALSILVNVALYVAYRNVDRSIELKRYDFTMFKENEWPNLDGRVTVLQDKVNSLVLANTVQQACKRR